MQSELTMTSNDTTTPKTIAASPLPSEGDLMINALIQDIQAKQRTGVRRSEFVAASRYFQALEAIVHERGFVEDGA